MWGGAKVYNPSDNEMILTQDSSTSSIKLRKTSFCWLKGDEYDLFTYFLYAVVIKVKKFKFDSFTCVLKTPYWPRHHFLLGGKCPRS